MAKKSIVETVAELVRPVADEMGIILWDVEFVKEGSKRILRITIDSEAGIDIDTCERFHRAIDPMLDEADPIEESYYLEVSSPGLERQIRTDEHILACIGKMIEVRLFAPVENQKVFTGMLIGYDGGHEVVIAGEGKIRAFERSDIAKMHTVFDFN